MDKLGQYITEEYGLLKQILYNLTTKDLLSAKEVCRNWAKVVDLILVHNSKPVWGYTLYTVHKKMDGWCQEPQMQILPKVIFYSLSSEFRKHGDCRNLESCPCKHGDISTELIFIRDETINLKTMLSLGPGSYDFMSHYKCMLLLPSMPGVHIDTVVISQKLDPDLIDDTINQLIGKEPIKCLLLFTHKITHSGRLFVSSFLNKLMDRQGSFPMAIGGGDSRKLGLFRRGKTNCKLDKVSIYVVAIRGENVTAHSELLRETSKEGIHDFMVQMSKNVGPVPSRSERLAFIVKCVNRCYLWDNTAENMSYEGKTFKEALPGVQHYGFVGFGEYGVNTVTCDCPEKKKPKCVRQVIHSDTTSFVIITLHNVHQRKILQL